MYLSSIMITIERQWDKDKHMRRIGLALNMCEKKNARKPQNTQNTLGNR